MAGETLIVPVCGRVGDLASIYHFNKTGTLIWKLLEGSANGADLTAALAREYGIEMLRAESDVMKFVEELNHGRRCAQDIRPVR